MTCGVSFRGTDGLVHICDVDTGIDHPGRHYCENHEIYGDSEVKK